MRRHLTLLAALLLALPPGTSATAAVLGSELVLVADGPATGTLTLPQKVTSVRYAVTTKSPYAAVVLTQDGRLEYGVAAFPEPGGGHQGYGSETPLPAGRSTVRVLAKGPVTFRFRGVGMRGRRTVRLRSPLHGALAVQRAVATTPTGAADDIDFATKGPSFVFHRATVSTTKLGPGASAVTFCALPREETCPRVPTDLSAGVGDWAEMTEMFLPWPWRGGARATFRSTHTPDPVYAARHWLIVVPAT